MQRSSSSCNVLVDNRGVDHSPIFEINENDYVLVVDAPPAPRTRSVGSSTSIGSYHEYCCKDCYKVFCKLPWRKRLVYVTTCFIYFMGSISYSVAFSFLPFECLSKGDSSTFSVGMIIGCFELTVFISSIAFGAFTDNSNVLFLFITGTLVEGFCGALFGVLTWCPGGTTFFVMAIAVRVVEALGCSMCQTAALSIIAKEFPQNTATFIGFIEASAGFGFMAGPPIGGILYEIGGFQLPFFVTGGCLFLFGIIAWCLVPHSASQLVPEDIRKPDLLKFLSIPEVLLSALFIASSAILTTNYDPTLSVELDSSFSLSPTTIGLVFLLDSVSYPLFSPLVGYLSDRFGCNFLLFTIGNIGFLVAYLLMGPLPFLPIQPRQLWTIITAIALVGVFLSFGFMPAFAVIIKSCTDAGMENNIALLGLVSGLFESAFSFGAFVGPFAGGYINDAIGFRWTSAVMILFPIINLVLIAIFCIYTKIHSFRATPR